MANNKTKKTPNNKTKKTPTVTTTSTGNPLYHVGATGRDVDAVGQYLVDNGYMNSYSGKYDSNMQSALQNAKKDLLGGSDYKGATFGAATLDAIAKKNADSAYNSGKNEGYNAGYNSGYNEGTAGLNEIKQMYSNMQTQQNTALQNAATAAKEEAYNSGKNEGYNAGYNSGYNEGTAGLNEIKQMYANMQSQQNAALQNANKLNQEQINSNYDNSAREYYRLYKTQQKQLPETLSRLGVTGGASESSQLKLLNSYSDNLYKNESARNNQLAGVNADYNNQIAENSINVANQMANARLQMAQQQLAYKRQDELAAKEQQAQAEENAAARTVAQWNANVRARMEEQLAKGDTIWTWTDESGRIHWTTYESRGLAMGGKKLSPSSSKVKSSGGSSTYSGGSGNDGNGGGGGDGGGGGVSYNDVKSQALFRLSRPAFEKNRVTSTLNGAQGALNYIVNSGLSESQQKKLAREIGLI